MGRSEQVRSLRLELRVKLKGGGRSGPERILMGHFQTVWQRPIGVKPKGGGRSGPEHVLMGHFRTVWHRPISRGGEGPKSLWDATPIKNDGDQWMRLLRGSYHEENITRSRYED